MIGLLTRLLFGLMYTPFYATCLALIYFDLRVRTEDFDLDELEDNLAWGLDYLVHAIAPSQAGDLSTAYAPHGVKDGKVVTAGEIGKFALITGGTLILAVISLVGVVAWMSIKPELSEAIYMTMTVNTSAPDFTLPNLNDQPITLSELRGKPTIINFWTTWCPPCNEELPALQATYTKHHQEVNLLAVSVREEKTTVQPFAQEKGLTFPILLDTNGRVMKMYQVQGYPTTVFLDAEGMIVNRHIGSLDEATIETYLEPLLPEEQTAVLLE
jgi:peroxiredoxin